MRNKQPSIPPAASEILSKHEAWELSRLLTNNTTHPGLRAAMLQELHAGRVEIAREELERLQQESDALAQKAHELGLLVRERPSG